MYFHTMEYMVDILVDKEYTLEVSSSLVLAGLVSTKTRPGMQTLTLLTLLTGG